jgi:hypothetical protein
MGSEVSVGLSVAVGSLVGASVGGGSVAATVAVVVFVGGTAVGVAVGVGMAASAVEVGRDGSVALGSPILQAATPARIVAKIRRQSSRVLMYPSLT